MTKLGRPVARLLLVLCLTAGATASFAQRHQGPGGGNMSPEDRQRLREEMNSARRDVYRGGPPPRGQPMPPPQPGRMSPEEREKLRRDMMDANRGMPRR